MSRDRGGPHRQAPACRSRCRSGRGQAAGRRQDLTVCVVQVDGNSRSARSRSVGFGDELPALLPRPAIQRTSSLPARRIADDRGRLRRGAVFRTGAGIEASVRVDEDCRVVGEHGAEHARPVETDRSAASGSAAAASPSRFVHRAIDVVDDHDPTGAKEIRACDRGRRSRPRSPTAIDRRGIDAGGIVLATEPVYGRTGR